MGHKVHPTVFRLGTTTSWPARWFARDQVYRDQLKEDIHIREFLTKELKNAALNKVTIERSRGVLTVGVHTAKPGLMIGRSGAGIEELRKKLLRMFFPGRTKTIQLHVSVQEVGRPSLESALVAQGVVTELERRMPFRRVLKQAIERVKKAGALGVKIAVSGRLNGAEIARREWLGWGKIPLTNLRADIDFCQGTAHTSAGTIGVKVWIYRGDVFAQDRLAQYQPTTQTRPERRTGGVGRSVGQRPGDVEPLKVPPAGVPATVSSP